MAVTELPLSLTSSYNNYVAAPHGLRTSWIYSFYIPPIANNVHAESFYAGGGFGTWGGFAIPGMGFVTIGSGATSMALGSIGLGGTPGNLQLYVQDSGTFASVVVQRLGSSTTATFPGGTLPLCVLVLDGVGRVQQVIDYRPSGLSSIPSYASGAVEVVSDPTKRAALATSFAVPRTFDLFPRYSTADCAGVALPTPGFMLSGGQVSISGNTITIPQTYITCKTTPVQLAVGQVTQIFVSATGTLTSQVTSTPGTFPASVLAICEATTDSIGLIRNIADYRPSYI